MQTDPKLVEFLLEPGSYPEKPKKIEHFETHISHVFVGDTKVYKIKKPVDFGFLDFTTLKKRRVLCDQEVVLNSRLARDFYLGLTEIYQKGDLYSFERKSGSKVAEYAVVMKRIPEDRILFNLIHQGRLLYGELDEVGERLAFFHQEVPEYHGRQYGSVASVTTNTEENFEQIKPSIGLTLGQAFYDRLVAYTREFVESNRKLFADRGNAGLVREVHGDLHSQHVCLTHPPVIFDCIEFNKRFRISDVLEDIAFLFMDLEFRGRFDLSRRLFEAYFKMQKDAHHEELLRFYKIYRAVVRGKIEGFTAQAVTDESHRLEAVRRAREYYALADFYLSGGNKAFNPVVFMGMSGSGKSLITTALFRDAEVLRSDVVRKEMLGIGRNQHVYVDYGSGIYSADITKRTYEAMADAAVRQASAGKRVILDATFLKAAQRETLFDRCTAAGLNPFVVYCVADEQTLRKRVARRMGDGNDVSDGHMAVLDRQLQTMEEPTELPFYRVMRLNTKEEGAKIRKALREFLA